MTDARLPRRWTLPAASTLLVALLAVSACEPDEEEVFEEEAPEVAAPPAQVPAPAPGAAPAMTDAAIAHVGTTANSLDSATAVTAQSRASDAEVKSFAQLMISDHSASNKKAAALAQRLDLTPQENDVSRQLQASAQRATQELEGKTGADFDRAYIAHEVATHQSVLDSLDRTLIPQAQNPELRALLQETRAMVEGHLRRAQQIQAKLGQ